MLLLTETETIDLSHTLYDRMPTYPSDPDIRLELYKEIEKHRSRVTKVSFGSHTATHVDAPAHILKEGKSLSDMDISSFWGKALKIGLDNYEFVDKFDMDGVILETGWHKNFQKPGTYFGRERPEIPLQLIEFLLDRNIKFFGCDLPSVDKSGVSDKIIHKNLLSSDTVIYENLCNLQRLPSGVLFTFIGFPLKLKDADGSPVRAVAIIEK